MLGQLQGIFDCAYITDRIRVRIYRISVALVQYAVLIFFLDDYFPLPEVRCRVPKLIVIVCVARGHIVLINRKIVCTRRTSEGP